MPELGKMSNGMQVVANMPAPPGACGVCRGTPIDEDGDPLPVIDTNVDINWGDTLYVCRSCSQIMGALMDMITEDDAAALRAQVAQLEKENETLTEDRDTLQDRIDRMLEGRKAVKEAKGESKNRKS